MPSWLGNFGFLVYRLAYCIALPPRLAAMILIPQDDNHLWPTSHWVLLALIMPFYLELLRLAWGRFTVRYNVRERLALAPAAPFPVANVPCPAPAAQVQTEPAPARAKAARNEAFDPGRRHFLLSAAAGSIGVATSGVGGYAALVEPEKLRIREYTIRVPDLPAEFTGFRMIHVSDTHYGPFVSMRTLEHAVKVINSLKGDLVVLTGDYMHKTKRSLKPGVGVLAGMKGRLGAVAVLGNHDHWEGTRDCYKAFDGIRVPLLDNRHLYLTPDGLAGNGRYPKGRTLCLAGVGDLWEDEVSYRKALYGVDERMPRIVLGHNPDVAEMIDPALRVDLLLSGHTHGGQIALPLLGPPKVGEYGYKYIGGLCKGPRCPVVVSRGVGMSGLPLRLNVPPELCVITLQPLEHKTA